MKFLRRSVFCFLLLVAALCLLPQVVSSTSYARQFRDIPNAAPSRHHLLGTDELGRDRLARLLYGTRVSLLLAPAAALLSTVLAVLIGGVAGFAGRAVEKSLMSVTDLFLSLPWLFLLVTVRALLPLNIAPMDSAIVTFIMLGGLGWAATARVVCVDTRSLVSSDFVLLAKASGINQWRVLLRHILPNIRPLLLAQFWISVPVFILAEVNLGMLGLGVSEPLPSWGGLLRELESFSSPTAQPWQFIPLVLLVGVVSSFHLVLKRQEFPG